MKDTDAFIPPNAHGTADNARRKQVTMLIKDERCPKCGLVLGRNIENKYFYIGNMLMQTFHGACKRCDQEFNWRPNK